MNPRSNDHQCLTDLLNRNLSCQDYENEPQVLTSSTYCTTEEFSSLTDAYNHDCLSVFNANSRSLMRNKDKYELLFEYLYSKNSFKFDVLCFDETWLSTDLENQALFDSYNAIFRHKQPQKKGGGLAIFIGKTLSYQVRSDIVIPEALHNIFDCLFVDIYVNKSKYTIGLMYRSPSHNSIPEVNRFLQDILETQDREGSKLILLGDLNINLLNVGIHAPTAEYLDIMVSSNLLPKVTLPTRVSRSSATLIDHLFTNIESSLAGTIRTDITDHYSNFLLIKLLKEKRHENPTHVSYRPMTDKTVEKLNLLLTSADWTDVYDRTDPTEAYSIFLHKYLSFLDKAMPQKKVCFNKYKHKSQPWITKGLLKSLCTKDKLYKVFKRCTDPLKKTQKEIEYKNYRNMYNSLIRSAKQEYWSRNFELNIQNTKQTWKNINALLKRNTNKSDFPEEFTDNITKYRSHLQIANGFNNYFVNVGPNLAASMPTTDLNSVYLPRLNLPNSFALTPTSPMEVAGIINKLKPKTSKDLSGISPKLIKSSSILLADPLSHIANISFQTGTFPKAMKTAKVIPIFKNKDKAHFQNYRPISLLPIFSKILERLAYNRLYKYLKQQNILTSSQYGFQKNISTEMAILELQNRIVKSISNKKWCVGIFLDLSKAFDTLDHRVLLLKLKHYGIRGMAFDWFRSYLSDREQYTEFRLVASKSLPIECGVPQGSILGPLLFLVYMNDVVHHMKHAKPILFADDSNLIFEHENLSHLTKIINDELKQVSNWFHLNKLSLNIEKTKYIVFRTPTKKSVNTNRIVLNGTPIEKVREIKFLGVYIDELLNWKHHITTKSNQIAKSLGIINRIKNFVPLSTRKTLYHSLILPHLSYGILAWGNTCSKEIKHMKILQKRAVRFIANAGYNAHTCPLFHLQNILTLDDIFRLQCCKFYLKKLKSQLPVYLSDQLQTVSETHNYMTRQRQHVRPSSVSVNLQYQLLSVKIAQVWNHLPEAITQHIHQSIESFSGKYQEHLVKQYPLNCEIRNCYICKKYKKLKKT